MQLLESTIEQELERFRTGNVTLSELTLAIERIQETEDTNRAKVRKTNLFLGRLAQQLNLPGLFTLPSGRHFVYMNRGRARTKSALPEYMTAREVQPLAQRNLIPSDARTALADLINTTGEPNVQQELPLPREFRYDDNGEMIPTDSAQAQDQRDAEAAAASPAPAAEPAAPTAEPAAAPTAAPTAGGSALERFASSNKGGLANDPDETEAITELQTFLVNELGLDTGGIGNGYGGRTRTAVRQFQRAVTGIAQDGDAGPETIGKISEIRRDMARIQELVNAIEDSNIADSVIPVRFKSGLAQLLERALTQTERTELEQLVSKYESFRRAFPNFQKDLFQQAEVGAQLPSAPTAQTDAPAQPAAPNASGEPATPGTDARPATNEPARPATPAADNAPPVPGVPDPRSAASVVADPDNTGNAENPDAQVFVQNTQSAAIQIRTAIRGLGTDEDTIFRVLSSIRGQQQWDQLQRDYQRLYRGDLVDDLIGDLGGITNNITSTDMVRYVWDALARAGVGRGNRLQANSGAPNSELERIRANAGLTNAIISGAAR